MLPDSVMALDLCLKARGFNSQPFCFQITTLGSLFTMCLFVTKQYTLAAVKLQWLCPVAVKVTVGRALHWLCITDLSGLFTYGLNGLRKGDEHPAYSYTPWSIASFTFKQRVSVVVSGPELTHCVVLFCLLRWVLGPVVLIWNNILNEHSLTNCEGFKSIVKSCCSTVRWNMVAKRRN